MKLYTRYGQSMYVEATPGDVVAAFRALDLPTRMRAAADVLEAANTREGKRWSYLSLASGALNGWADRWEAEDAEKVKRDSEIEELAQALAKSAGYATPDSMAYKRAQDLYGWGYRKQATDE